MIGQLINEFENSTDDNFKRFNDMFRTNLKASENSEVTIGDMLSGGRREVFINEKRYVVILGAKRVSDKVMVTKYNISKNGKNVDSFYNIKDVADFLGISKIMVYHRIHKNRPYGDFTIKKSRELVTKLESLTSYRSKSACTQRFEYVIKNNNHEISFRAIRDISGFLDTYDAKIILALKMNGELLDYTIKKRSLSKKEIKNIRGDK